MNTYSRQIPVHAVKTKEMGSLGIGIINLVDKEGKVYDSAIPHRHTFYELIVFMQARGSHEIDFNNYKVQNHSVHFVSPGQIHRLKLEKKKGYVICFTEDFVSLKSKGRFTDSFPYFNNSSYPVLRLPEKTSSQLEELIKSIDLELAGGNPDSVEICRSYLNIVLLKLKTQFNGTPDGTKKVVSEKNQKVNYYKTLIEENYLSHKTVSDYADDLSISPNHLNALCKKQEGKTATQLIQERVLLEAKRLLYATDMHIKEISFHLHFEDVPYFNRFFKKQARITPNEYRDQFRKKR